MMKDMMMMMVVVVVVVVMAMMVVLMMMTTMMMAPGGLLGAHLEQSPAERAIQVGLTLLGQLRATWQGELDTLALACAHPALITP